MLDVKFIRENQKKVEQAARDKGVDHKPVAKVIKLDKKRRELLSQIEEIRFKKNKLTRDDVEEGRKLKIKLKKLEPSLREVDVELEKFMLMIPGVPDESVPVGKDEKDNEVVKTWGKKPEFDFKPKNHLELGEDLDLLDVKRGARVGGFRGYFLKNEAVLMQMGVMQYALNKLIEKGFSPMIPPIIVKKQALINTGHFPWGEVDVYKTFDDEKEKDTRYLAGTAEVPLVSYHSGETLNEKDLPILYAGFSSCYRREIGSYGRDTQGIYRVHEFMKIEQVVLCKNDMKESLGWLEKLSSYSEEMLQELELPYRKMMMCTGDMGEPQIKKYDIETWMPGRDSYGETMSDSIMGEFQSRRAKIKYRTKDGEVKFVHMLNNTALAAPRILVAIFENYQQKDGSIRVPKVLQQYVNKKIITKKR